MMNSNGFFHWNKRERLQFSAYFTSLDFQCPCSHPHENVISISLIDKLNDVRHTLNSPIIVTSGYRCELYQQELKARGYETAKGTSPHQLGNAVDIAIKDLSKFDQLLKLCENEFKAIGVGNGWLHVDMRSDAIRRWKYKG